MKKFLKIIIALALTLSLSLLASCADGDKTQNPNGSDPTQTPPIEHIPQ